MKRRWLFSTLAISSSLKLEINSSIFNDNYYFIMFLWNRMKSIILKYVNGLRKRRQKKWYSNTLDEWSEGLALIIFDTHLQQIKSNAISMVIDHNCLYWRSIMARIPPTANTTSCPPSVKKSHSQDATPTLSRISVFTGDSNSPPIRPALGKNDTISCDF